MKAFLIGKANSKQVNRKHNHADHDDDNGDDDSDDDNHIDDGDNDNHDDDIALPVALR